MINPSLDQTENQDKVIHDFGLDINYLNVKCGSAMTVAQIDKSPYLLIWGYNSFKAWGFPDLFENDPPVIFQAVGAILYVLTQKQILYRINAEERNYERIEEIEVEGFDDVMEQGGQVHNMACGSDFILTTNGAGNVYAKGANKFGQLGLGNVKPQPKFKCIESLLDTNVQAIYAGQRSAFAFSDLTENIMSQFTSENNKINEEAKIEPL